MPRESELGIPTVYIAHTVTCRSTLYFITVKNVNISFDNQNVNTRMVLRKQTNTGYKTFKQGKFDLSMRHSAMYKLWIGIIQRIVCPTFLREKRGHLARLYHR